jgi:hypothetical protein
MGSYVFILYVGRRGQQPRTDHGGVCNSPSRAWGWNTFTLDMYQHGETKHWWSTVGKVTFSLSL